MYLFNIVCLFFVYLLVFIELFEENIIIGIRLFFLIVFIVKLNFLKLNFFLFIYLLLNKIDIIM